MSVGLTPQMKACLEAVERLTVDGVSPTLDELRSDLGLAGKANVHRLLVGLKERNFVDWQYHRARSLRIIPQEIRPGDLQNMSTAALLQGAAHIAGALAYRQGSKLTSDAFARIAARIGRLAVRAFLEAG